MPEIVYFKTQRAFHSWLAKNHAKEKELWLGFYKVGADKKGITYKEAVDEALGYGWIDAIRKSIDKERYTIRFTIRKPTSIWSVVNIRRVEELKAMGSMQEPGLAAFAKRNDEKSAVYSFEQENPKLGAEAERIFKKNKAAWKFFKEQAPWYQRAAGWWVESAKREETKQKRLETLIMDSEEGRRIKHLTRP
jgi:uncharacterized protein YdeI (YjbR/CyaY-like superfamily)